MTRSICAIGNVTTNRRTKHVNHVMPVIVSTLNPTLSNKDNAIVDFSDCHPLSTEGFFNYMTPLLPSKYESKHNTPILPPKGHLKSVVACASSILSIALFTPVTKLKTSRKLNKTPRTKPLHKVYCPSSIEDCWEEIDDPTLDDNPTIIDIS